MKILEFIQPLKKLKLFKYVFHQHTLECDKHAPYSWLILSYESILWLIFVMTDIQLHFCVKKHLQLFEYILFDEKLLHTINLNT